MWGSSQKLTRADTAQTHGPPSIVWISLADPGKARGCSINSLVINSLTDWFSQPFPLTALRRRHTQMVRDWCSSYKIDYVIGIKTFLNTEGHQIPISGSKVTAILLKGSIWPIGGASLGEGLRSTGLPRLVNSAILFLQIIKTPSFPNHMS